VTTTTALDVGDKPMLTYVPQVSGTPTNATVTLTVTRPDGSPLTGAAIENPAPGTYTASIDVDLAGIWSYKWSATGAVVDVETGTFRVVPATTSTVYATVSELRSQFRDDTEAMDDKELKRVLRAVSRGVDLHCGRRFWRDTTASTRVFRADEPGLLWVDDFYSTTDLVVETDPAGNGTWSETWTVDDYQPEPLNAAAMASDGTGAFAWWQLAAVGSRSFPSGFRRAQARVTTRWGWSAHPDQVAEATLLKAASLYKRRDAPFGVAGVGDFGVIRIGRFDPDVIDLLRPPLQKFRPRTLSYDPQRSSLFHGRGR